MKKSKILEKLTYYEDLEEKLQQIYGECDGLLESAVNSLVRHEGTDIGKPIKARLLTDEDVDEWESLKKSKEKGTFILLPYSVGDTVYIIMNGNIVEGEVTVIKSDYNGLKIKIFIGYDTHIICNPNEIFATKDDVEEWRKNND